MTEENLWDFLELEGMREKPLEILGGFELLRLLDQFFDQAVTLQRSDMKPTSAKSRQKGANIWHIPPDEPAMA